MNQTQINNFLMCLERIDDINYLYLHERAAASNDVSTTKVSSISGAEDDHDHENEISNSHDLLIAKITAMVVLFIASSICGSIPFMLNRCFKWTENNADARSATLVQCMLYFGGGVLMCTTFLHLLPEVEKVVQQLQECKIIPELTFALPQLLMCSGFLLMYLIEEVIHTVVHRHKHIMEKDHGAGAAFERGHSVRKSYLVKGGAKSSSDDDLTDETTNTCNGTISQQDLISNDAENQKYETQVAPIEHSDHHTTNEHNRSQQQHANGEHGHSHLPIASGGDDDDMVTSSLRGLFIVMALSLHELFEGMSIGLESSSASAVWFMFGAVSAHKLVLAFCVGVELIVARTRPALSFVYVFTFAVVSPIGIGVGILITHNTDSSGPSIPSAILQGLACGTLLYVVFFEILSKQSAGLIAYLSLIVGFGLMFGLQQLDQEHGHSHCGGSYDSSTTEITTDVTFSAAVTATSSPAAAVKQHLSFEEQMTILRQASKHILEKSKKTN